MITQKILSLIEPYSHEVLEHDHVHSSKDAAQVRNTKLQEAAKALVLKAKKDGQDYFFMCIVSGHKKIDLKKIKKLLGVKNASLAHPDEVLEKTGCKVGTVPPFPSLLGLDGFADTEILENEHVVFSVASHYKSVRMKSEVWVKLSGAVLYEIS